MKIACISLGCPKNQVDLDVMVHSLLSAGHETVADLAEADAVLVNTCGFIESAKTEAIENILEALIKSITEGATLISFVVHPVSIFKDGFNLSISSIPVSRN